MRSCLTCHTFQNTCAECHVNKVVQNAKPQPVILARNKVDLVGLLALPRPPLE